MPEQIKLRIKEKNENGFFDYVICHQGNEYKPPCHIPYDRENDFQIILNGVVLQMPDVILHNLYLYFSCYYANRLNMDLVDCHIFADFIFGLKLDKKTQYVMEDLKKRKVLLSPGDYICLSNSMKSSNLHAAIYIGNDEKENAMFISKHGESTIRISTLPSMLNTYKDSDSLDIIYDITEEKEKYFLFKQPISVLSINKIRNGLLYQFLDIVDRENVTLEEKNSAVVKVLKDINETNVQYNTLFYLLEKISLKLNSDENIKKYNTLLANAIDLDFSVVYFSGYQMNNGLLVILYLEVIDFFNRKYNSVQESLISIKKPMRSNVVLQKIFQVMIGKCLQNNSQHKKLEHKKEVNDVPLLYALLGIGNFQYFDFLKLEEKYFFSAYENVRVKINANHKLKHIQEKIIKKTLYLLLDEDFRYAYQLYTSLGYDITFEDFCQASVCDFHMGEIEIGDILSFYDSFGKKNCCADKNESEKLITYEEKVSFFKKRGNHLILSESSFSDGISPA